MKKREFLAMGGAVPLMLAGCGNGSGSAPVRLVNASVGYPALGFMVESTQATSTDVPYGGSSPFESVEGGAVDITLTVKNSAGVNSSATAAQTRTINKDQRYSLVAYGAIDELKLVLVAESTTTPDTGKANINVLDTSFDIGAVDIYLSTSKDLSVSSLIASNVAASSTSPSQSAFAGIVAGSYYITVVGHNNLTDVRFQSSSAVVLTALQVYTIILTPGSSGTLANAIFLQQGTTATTPVVNLPNTTARVRGLTAIYGSTTLITSTDTTGAAITILNDNTSQFTGYSLVSTGAAPTVKVNGAVVTPFMIVSGVQMAASLSAGGDYTMMVYPDASGNPVAQLLLDDNTAPVQPQGIKFRFINLAGDQQGLKLSMTVNSAVVAAQLPYGTASAYKEFVESFTIPSSYQFLNGTNVLVSQTGVSFMTDGIYTGVVTRIANPKNGATDYYFLSAASGT